jgi:hypothetical protein
MPETNNYPDDCMQRAGIKCKLFQMSCAQYHATIFGYYGGRCFYYNRHLDCYYEKPENRDQLVR